jgi:hypothetical protein
MKSNNFAMDKIAENNKVWQKQLEKHDRRWEEFCKKHL